MALEASIVERLQELRKWQADQQDRLLKQQQEQRELLTIEQERMYEAFGLSIKDVIVNESIIDAMSVSKMQENENTLNDSRTNQPEIHDVSQLTPNISRRLKNNSQNSDSEHSNLQLNVPNVYLNNFDPDLLTPSDTSNYKHLPRFNLPSKNDKIEETKRFCGDNFDVSVEGVQPLGSDDKSLSKCLLIDELPLPSPRKDFKTLLEEKLRDDSVNVDVSTVKNQVKRPFLRKGEGLARFRMHSPANKKNKPTTTSPSSRFTNSPSNSRKNTKSINKPKVNCKKKSSELSRRSVGAIPNVAQQKLILSNVALPKKIVRNSRSLPASMNSNKLPDKCLSNDESNQSDLDSSKLETKMFEMLEEKAENSSFCSTSSAVIAFMQQSTPLKLKNTRKNLITQKQTTNATDPMNNFPNDNTQIRELNSRKNIVKSKWDSGPFPDEHSSQSIKDVQHVKILSTLNSKSQFETEDKTETSMHVRFSEYNEYKTIGLTDTSTLSTDSRAVANYDEEKDWSDSNYEDSSDFETLPTKEHVIDEQIESLPPINDYNYKNTNSGNERLIARDDEHSDNSDSNSVSQSTDDEHSIFNDSEGTYYDEDLTVSEIQQSMAKILNEPEIDLPTTDAMKSASLKLSETNDTIFKSDLLKNRLLELEREIDIFRKENSALSLQRQKIQDEHRQLQREFKEKEVNLERERSQMSVTFQEEKRRLAREKSALENRLRDAREKSIQNKQERQEIQFLNEQLNELRDDIAEKESRWQAAQARQRSQIRVLQMENSKLKLEIERLQATKRGNGKLKRPSYISNTKSIHQINKQLDNKRGTLHNPAISDEELETVKNIQKKNSDTSTMTNHSPSSNIETGKIIVYNPVTQNPIEGIVLKKRQLYETLLKDAAVNYERNYEKSPIILENDDDDELESRLNYENKRDIDLKAAPMIENDSEELNKNIGKINDENKEEIVTPRSSDDLKSQQSIRGSYQQFVRDVINPRNESNQFTPPDSNLNGEIKVNSPKKNPYQLNYSSEKKLDQIDAMQKYSSIASVNKRNELNECSKGEQKQKNYVDDRLKFICPPDSDLTPRVEHQNPLPRPPENMTPHPEQIQVSQISNLSSPGKFNSSSSSPLGNHNIREVKHPDGHVEYWYPNGNVKRVYPDRNITKMIYYNGDVRETTSDGCIKYFYAATKTWHTTYPDGFEIIEFPDGQQERRTKDGIVEVTFTDGSVRLIQPDGIEKWALPDGTIAETFPNGEKILSLPNGQREIHTNDHKRREYPDGTVKFVYPDGTQETRYSNGRVRIKDKDGKLVMDSYSR